MFFIDLIVLVRCTNRTALEQEIYAFELVDVSLDGLPKDSKKDASLQKIIDVTV